MIQGIARCPLTTKTAAMVIAGNFYCPDSVELAEKRTSLAVTRKFFDEIHI